MASSERRDLIEEILIVMRDHPEDYDAPTPVATLQLSEVLRMSESDKTQLLRDLLEFVEAHKRPRPLDEPIRGNTFLL